MSELINVFSQVSGLKINIQKSVAFLYTTNDLSEKEIKKDIPFAVALKSMKYLGININMEVKDPYIVNY